MKPEKMSCKDKSLYIKDENEKMYVIWRPSSIVISSRRPYMILGSVIVVFSLFIIGLFALKPSFVEVVNGGNAVTVGLVLFTLALFGGVFLILYSEKAMLVETVGGNFYSFSHIRLSDEMLMEIRKCY